MFVMTKQKERSEKNMGLSQQIPSSIFSKNTMTCFRALQAKSTNIHLPLKQSTARVQSNTSKNIIKYTYTWIVFCKDHQSRTRQ